LVGRQNWNRGIWEKKRGKIRSGKKGRHRASRGVAMKLLIGTYNSWIEKTDSREKGFTKWKNEEKRVKQK